LALNGAKNLQVGSLQSDIGFVLDMEELDGIVVGGPSHMLIDIEITGRSAHAGIEPEKGISAIRVASQAIALLHEGWADRETTVNVGTIEGGEIRNGVPEKVQIKAECRSLDHQKCLVQGERIRQTFELIAQLAGARSKIDLTLAYEAVLVPPDASVVSFAERALRHVGIEPRRIVICGGTDASILNAKGIQTVALGTGMMNPHTVEESIAESEMVRAAEVIVQLFALLAEDV
jgi:tripeptide aminopeptidase